MIKNRKFTIGFILFVIVLIFSFIIPFFYNVDPNKTNLMMIEKYPNHINILGTDQTGRDVFTRLMYGGRVSIYVGIIATSVKMLISIILGFLSAYFKRLDKIIMRICDIFMCFPFYVLAISISAFTKPSLKNLIIIISLLTFSQSTRILRTEIKVLKDMEYIQILKVNGEKFFKILLNHIIPNIKNTILVIFTTSVAQSILMESSLSFFGMGVQEPISSWGSMLSVTLNILNIQKKWWLWLPAGISIITLVFSVNIMGEGLKNDRS